MKYPKSIGTLLTGAFLATALLTACSGDEAYETSVTRDIEITLDGKPWGIYYGTSNKPLFIYHGNGDYFSNYSSSYHFALDDGSYKVIATNQEILLTPPTSLNEQTIPQDTLTKTAFAISDPVDYHAGASLVVPMKTRTGVLRLKANDVKADKSYTTIRAHYATPVQAYHVGEAKMITGEPLQLVRDKGTTGGGIGYTDDAILLETESTGTTVTVTLDYLASDGTVVKTRTFDEGFAVLPNDTTIVDFSLNDADEPVIMNYRVTLASSAWSNETIYPSVAVDVPEGYTLVKPGDNLDDIYNQLKNDESISEIRLFLKANGNYTFSTNTLNNMTKALSIKAQEPGFGQQKATLSLGALSMTGDFSEISFENLTLKPGDRFFNLRNQQFNVGNITFKNCDFPKWSGTMWYQQTNADRQQVVNTITMEGCRLTDYTAGKSALWGLSTKKVAPVYNWVFRNNVFHGNFGSKTFLLGGLKKTDGNVTVAVAGNTFYDTVGSTCTFFDIDGSGADGISLTVSDNRMGGTSGTATWFKIGKNVTTSASGNTRASDYTLGTWGIDEPAVGDYTSADLLNSLNLK